MPLLHHLWIRFLGLQCMHLFTIKQTSFLYTCSCEALPNGPWQGVRTTATCRYLAKLNLCNLADYLYPSLCQVGMLAMPSNKALPCVCAGIRNSSTTLSEFIMTIWIPGLIYDHCTRHYLWDPMMVVIVAFQWRQAWDVLTSCKTLVLCIVGATWDIWEHGLGLLSPLYHRKRIPCLWMMHLMRY